MAVIQQFKGYMKINNFDFNYTNDIYICAEIGINHNGSINDAKKLIKIASECGCNAVKLQKRSPEHCVPHEQREMIRETPWGKMTYFDYKKKIEFSIDQIYDLSKYANKLNIDFFCSVWDILSLQELISINTVAIKIPSALITDNNLVESIKKTNLPVIWSTGMSDIKEINNAYNILKDVPNIICHCNSSYPASENELNLNYIPLMKKNYPNSIIGYSGHEVGLLPSIIAVVKGAKFIERHITLDRSSWGTDQSASIEPQGLNKLVKDIRRINIILGKPEKILFNSELSARKKLRGI